MPLKVFGCAVYGLVLLAATLSKQQACTAAAISIDDPSFESVPLADGTFAVVTWGDVSTLVFNPDATATSNGGTTDGKNAAATIGELQQTLFECLAPNATYTLSADFGRPLNELVWGEFLGYVLELAAGGTVLDSENGHGISPGIFQQASVTFTPSANSPAIGKRLVIRADALGGTMFVDNVRLDATFREPDSEELVRFANEGIYSFELLEDWNLQDGLVVERGISQFNLNGETLTIGASSDPVNRLGLVVGESAGGPAAMQIFAGEVHAEETTIGHLSGSRGTLRVTGADTLFETFTDLVVGREGEGQLSIQHIELTPSPNPGQPVPPTVEVKFGDVIIGESRGSVGHVTVGTSDTSGIPLVPNGILHIENDGKLVVGKEGNGTLIIDLGQVVVDGSVIIGEDLFGVGKIVLQGSGSVLDWDKRIDVGYGGAGILEIFDGAVLRPRNIVGSRISLAEVSYANFPPDAEDVEHYGTMTVNGVGSRFETEFLRVAPPPSGLKEGSLLLQDRAIGIVTNTLLVGRSGMIDVGERTPEPEEDFGGTLLVGNVDLDPALLETGVVYVGTGGEIQGRGRIRGDVINLAGLLSPGSSPGELEISGNYSQSSAGALLIEIGGLPTEDHDKLVVGGDVELGGLLILSFINGFAPRQGDTFQFIAPAGESVGTFDDVRVLGLLAGFQYQLSTIEGSGLVLEALNDGVSVPEPGVCPLLLAIALGLLRSRKSRSR